MTTWRYKAVPAAGGAVVTGEHTGETAAEVRGALHRAGLRVLELRSIRRTAVQTGSVDLLTPIRRQVERHLRTRHGPRKAELLDALATMLEAGIPLVEAVASITSSTSERSGRLMLVQLRDHLRDGAALADAMAGQPAWFDAAEAAMVRAGQQSGELPGVLRSLSERHTRSGELAHRLASALAYPMIVAAVGVGVVLFLSTKTLPELSAVLTEAGLEVPVLTGSVMAFGRLLLAGIPWAMPLIVLIAPSWVIVGMLARRTGLRPPSWPDCFTPRVIRRAAVADVLLSLSDLLRTGVPAVEAFRVLAPTTGGVLTARLGMLLSHSAERVEHGESIADAINDEHWFPDEVRRLIRIGEQSGELDAVLGRLGQRYQRSARRLTDRLTAFVEPVVILVLAIGIGIVVMAAVLPLVRLQEML